MGRHIEKLPSIKSGKRNGLKRVDADEQMKNLWECFNGLNNCYDMNDTKYFLIFNTDSGEKARNGTTADETLLENIFSKLGFKVKKYDIENYNDITNDINTFLTQDHTTTSCICVAILAYSDERGDVCAPDKPYDIQDMQSLFHKSSDLADKPKVFFIQKTVKDEQHDKDDKNVKIKMNTKHFGADTIIAYSTVYENITIKKKEPSWISLLCHAIVSYPKADILDILTMVNASIASNPDNPIPQCQSTLTKTLKFVP